MAIVPDHPIWQRNRRKHHGGAWREYTKFSSTNDPPSPRGPGVSPAHCSKCELPENEDNSPLITSDYCSGSSQSSPEDQCSTSSFNMTGIMWCWNKRRDSGVQGRWVWCKGPGKIISFVTHRDHQQAKLSYLLTWHGLFLWWRLSLMFRSDKSKSPAWRNVWLKESHTLFALVIYLVFILKSQV